MVSESKFQVTIRTQIFTNSVAFEITSLSELQVSYLQMGLTRISTSRVIESKHDKTLKRALSKALKASIICSISVPLKPFLHAYNQYVSIY